VELEGRHRGGVEVEQSGHALTLPTGTAGVARPSRGTGPGVTRGG
jgi:hypothetical protein